ncbi:MAG: hypothetical protein NZM44_00270, partial [Candidatus Calescibacterium sp.]|nr:hypothetical protein [Candidatus Calescibacterium sp.]
MYKTEKVSDFVKFLETSNIRGFKRYVYIVKYLLTKFVTWFYLTFIVRIISLPLNLYYVFSALLAGELKNIVMVIKHMKKTLKSNPEQFWDYYYTYASYSYYTPDELIEIYGKSTKTFVKDWNSWFITSVIRKFKGDCDDYTVITSKLLSFAGEKSRKYVTFATAIKDGKLVFSKDA